MIDFKKFPKNKSELPLIITIVFFIIILIVDIIFVANLNNIDERMSESREQNDNTAETEDSFVEENISSSDTLFEEDTILQKLNFDGKIAYFKDEKSVNILDSKSNDEVTINLDMYWQTPITPFLSWSPDGSKLIMGFGMDLYTINVIDGSVKKIYSLKTDRVDDEDSIDNRGYFEAVSWSPDGLKILFTVTPYDTSYIIGEEPVSNKIILIDADGSNEKILLENYELRYLGFAWSPDGSKLVFSTGKSRTHHYYIGNYGDQNYEQVSFPGEGHVQLWVMDLNNNIVTQIADFTGWWNDVNHQGNYVHNCSWSPDGEKILFDLLYNEWTSGYDIEKSMIYIMDSNGENVKEFLQGYSPNWSSDGDIIIYGGTEQNEDYELPIIIVNNFSEESEIIGWGVNPVWYLHE